MMLLTDDGKRYISYMSFQTAIKYYNDSRSGINSKENLKIAIDYLIKVDVEALSVNDQASYLEISKIIINKLDSIP